MATRNPKGPKPGDRCTEFQLHKSQLTLEIRDRRRLLDYTEHRLTRYIKQLTDEIQKATLKRVLADYRAGKVVVAWQEGKPVWYSVTRESSKD